MRVFVGFIHRTTRNASTSTMTTPTASLKIRTAQNTKVDLSNLTVMDQKGVSVDCSIYDSLLEFCINSKSLAEGKQIHAHLLLSGEYQNMFLRSKLANMYAMCDSLVDAHLVFDKTQKPQAFLWNVMIRGYASKGWCEAALKFYCQMHVTVQPDNFTFPFVLKACADISAYREGIQIHGYIIQKGFASDLFVGNSLVALYAKCGWIRDARQVFDKMYERDVVSWNCMIGGYVQNGCCDEALNLFEQMELAVVKPNSVTILNILPACANLEALQLGQEIHDYIIRSGIESQGFVRNALIDMYAKCGVIEKARLVFDKMSERNVVSWNAMISGYVQAGHSDEAFKNLHQMQLVGMKPDSITIASILPACAHLTALQKGKEIHNYIIRNGFESDIFVANSLVDMYCKCRSIEVARQVFDRIYERNAVSWSAMIAGYAQNGHDDQALNLFHQMQLVGTKMNPVTITNVLPACAHLSALQRGKEIHGHILRTGLESDIFVGNGLIDMYAKCKSLGMACNVFEKMSEIDVVSFNSMITGYAQNCHCTDALKLFKQMELASMKPDSVTIVSILLACARLSALRQGKEIHDYIIRGGFESHAFVVNALIDMYAKCGNVCTARQVFNKISQRDVASWNTMIVGYGMQGHGSDALMIFQQMQQARMKPDHITFIAILSACSHSGLVDQGRHYFDRMCQEQITPRGEHYACMVDLFGRAGQLDEALDFINKMPLEPDANVWGALLGACRIHCNIELGEHAAEHLFELEPDNAGYYVLMSNIYAAAGRWDGVAKVRSMMKARGLKKNPGCSWIDVNNRVNAFLVGDRTHPQSEKIYAKLRSLAMQMKEAGYVPDTKFVLRDMEEDK
eukprot:Gb_03545 [translate_table: standard]